jgi:hypothetical protein
MKDGMKDGMFNVEWDNMTSQIWFDMGDTEWDI